MSSIGPNKEQLEKFVNSKDTGSFIMINLLKFKRDGDDFTESYKLYKTYMAGVGPLLNKVNGRLLWMGSVQQIFIGEDKDAWDQVLLVEYPSRKAFLKLIGMDEYQEIHHLRENALEDSALLAADSLFGVFKESAAQ